MWFTFGSEDIGKELREIKELVMTANEDLQQVKSNLAEASQEIVAKIDQLTAQVGDAADPQLVSDIKGLAQGLADIVPNAVPEGEVTEVPDDAVLTATPEPPAEGEATP